MSENIVGDWLRSMRLSQYAEGFIDNGYDDLEICKQIGEPDLDAIGVVNSAHRTELLRAVRILREQGGTAVYFTLEEVGLKDEPDYSTYMYDDELSAALAKAKAAGGDEEAAGTFGAESGADAGVRKYNDEYEEGKAELVKIPRLQLKGLIRDRLAQDGIRLSSPPYSNSDGSKGHLDDLAAKLADDLKTLYSDVVEHLESLRQKEVQKVLSSQVKLSPSVECLYQASTSSCCNSPSLYKPGKYSPSSCLSDQEEEEIYGYGYGVYARRIYKHHANRLACLATPQRCLTPRSHYFYETCPFPATSTELKETVESTGESPKKRGPLGRIFRGLTSRKEKNKEKGSGNKQVTPMKQPISKAPEEAALLYEGPYGSHDFQAGAEERMKLVLMVKDGQISMEQAFDRMRQYEVVRWKANQEEIFKDLRHGVLNKAHRKAEPKETAKFYTTVDRSVYGSPAVMGPGHWYDDPPYESDPDELQGVYSCCNSKVALSMPYVEGADVPIGRPSMSPASWVYSGDNVILTRTAGDIQMAARDHRLEYPIRFKTDPSNGVDIHQHIPLTSTTDTNASSSKRDSLDSPKDDTCPCSSPTQGRKTKMFSKLKSLTSRGSISASEEGLSQSSDYEDQDDLETKMERRFSRDITGRASSFVERVKGLRSDVKKKISKLRPNRTVSESEQAAELNNTEVAIRTSASSVESIPSGSGSSVQALTTSSSNRSSTSVEEEAPVYTGPFIGKARALVDYTPSPYDKDVLRFKKGDIIDIISMSQTGSWTGMLNNRIGHFKFINVELIPENKPRNRRTLLPRRRNSKRGKPKSVEELLQRINLEEHISVFVLNGYENLDLFKELEEEDLDYLGINDPEHRAKILTAVELLHDYDSPEADDDVPSDDQCDAFKLLAEALPNCTHSPRDSGCYASNENLQHRETIPPSIPPAGSGDISQSESGIHSSDGMDPSTSNCNPSNNLDGGVSVLAKQFGEQCLNEAINGQVKTDGFSDAEICYKHDYLPNILPGTVCTEADVYMSSGILHSQPAVVNGCCELEPLSKMKLESPFSITLESDQSQILCFNDNFGSSTLSQINVANSHFPESQDFHRFPSFSSRAPHSSFSTLHSVRSHSLDRSNSPVAVASTSASPVSTFSVHSKSGAVPRPSSQPWVSDSNQSKSKSATMPRKPNVPKQIIVPHLQGNAKKHTIFKEPFGSGKSKLQSSRMPRPVSETLELLLQRKLQDELIDITVEPYTDKTGFCGIPPALVQRYSEEVKRDVKEVADALDHIRITYLQQQGRQGVPNDFLADSCYCPIQEANYSSLAAWLVSVGLPMYTDPLNRAGYSQLHEIAHLTENELRACGINDPRHLRRLMSEIEALIMHLQKFGC